MLFFGILLSCKTEKPDTTNLNEISPPVFIGYDINHKGRTCFVPQDNRVCKDEAKGQLNFKDTCIKNGFKVYLCGCSDYLCSQSLIKK